MGNQPINVKSEIGQLRTVLVHRPGNELNGVTPAHLNSLLFDDIVYLKQAQKEHDDFTSTLRKNGVEVLYLDQMVTDALPNSDIKMRFISDMVRASKQGDRRTTYGIIDYLGRLDTKSMVRKIMAGVSKEEVTFPESEGVELHSYFASEKPFYLDPMPNLYFTRDPATSIGNGISINKMRFPARRRESLFMEYILKFHPRFARHNVPVWYDRYGRFSVEGGDILVLSDQVVAIGVSMRTTPEAIEKIAHKLFKDSEFKEIIVVKLPSKHQYMHLDTVLTMVDYGKFLYYEPVLAKAAKPNIYRVRKAEDTTALQITQHKLLKDVLEAALQRGEVQMLPVGGGQLVPAQREQWSDGANVLALSPGVVLAYDRNHVTNETLAAAGVEVIPFSGSELSRGHGGPRCMTMPFVRDNIY